MQRFEINTSQQKNHLCAQQMIDYFGITYDILRDELNEMGSAGSIIIKNRSKDGVIDITINAGKDEADHAIALLHKHGFLPNFNIAREIPILSSEPKRAT
jgi:hypothetical protein